MFYFPYSHFLISSAHYNYFIHCTYLQGDTLFIERPYAKPPSSGQCCLEYAPGTIIYLAPYRPQEVSFAVLGIATAFIVHAFGTVSFPIHSARSIIFTLRKTSNVVTPNYIIACFCVTAFPHVLLCDNTIIIHGVIVYNYVIIMP